MLEYLPSATRATIVIVISVFWSFGGIFEYLLAMFIIPAYGWRILTILSALPITIVAICMYVSIVVCISIERSLIYDWEFSSFRNHLDIIWPVVDKRKRKIF